MEVALDEKGGQLVQLFIIPTLVDFSYCFWEAESETPAIFPLHFSRCL
jgi:hypothetical protein